MPAAEDLALLEAAARAGGAVALRYWRNAPKSWEKDGDAGPVSEADLAVNDALEAQLRTARPGYGWLSEESPDGPERLAARRLFIIDPIDGTRSYLNNQPDFALSMAVVEDGRPIAGVVYLPAKNRLYAASAGGPALCNGQPIHCSTRQALSGADVLSNRSTLAPENWPGGLPPVKRSFRSSIAYRLCLVAEGRHDAMLALRPSWEWDIAAGSLIAERAGCEVLDSKGEALRFNQSPPLADGIIAANPSLQAQLMQARRL
ncbi:3'(2'),5'-bisphosphate nucleotidase CysQ [Xinfangfangia sp. CPCC 101601]|uniref:3'(2'),5'-bisphosphate nucleotidase CysQ n=1 Tax=Pseudogemmobacter lacusdianii TaxID=3069608 RepID=A0ABU0VX86_9RHOB|nr:3'(2'),5'-bisphosphate nucleotidase CysQ [Xinfangfangia sp. CPCC 101601]MDQ2066380.1 3'(2'),5'-bisphosphate nucleotidase CysQ [Xinfangfangia sp. CPCC 101601]